MSSDKPELIHVPLETYKGVRRHSFQGLLRHLEQQMDPSLSENVLFFFLTGSRLYGTSTPDSDWDYVCITKRPTKEARKSLACQKGGDELIAAAKPFMLTESNVYDMEATLEFYGLPLDEVPETLRFDVSFCDLAVWTRMAQEQSILPLEAQCVPESFILYRDPTFPVFKIDPPVLKTTASLLGGLKFANARPRLDKEGNLTKARKLGALGVRFLQFGIQLLESYRDNHGNATITNFESIAPVWTGLFLKHEPPTYADFELIYRPTFKALDTYIRQIMVYPTLYTVRENFSLRWIAIKATLSKLDKIPKAQALEWPPWLSPNSQSILNKLANGDIKQCISTYHLYPNLSKCNTVLTLALTSNAPIYSVPGLSELHGLIITLPEWKIVGTSKNEGLLKDLITMYGEKDDNVDSELVKLLEDDTLLVSELYDGIRTTRFKHNGEWMLATYGGSADGSERLAMRTTEGRGPPKTTVSETFNRMFPQIPQSLQVYDDPNSPEVQIYELLSNCSRTITANNPERLVRHLRSPFDGLDGGIHVSKFFSDLTKELRSIKGFKERLQKLKESVEFLNPFETAGFQLQSLHTSSTAKISSRSYWSVKASIGHQNRVLAFNVAADHFESEALFDVCIFGFDREFSSTFPKWKSAIYVQKLELKKLQDWLVSKTVEPFKCPDRKSLAAHTKDFPVPVKSIIFEWYGFPFVPVADIISSLDTTSLRSLKLLFSQNSSETLNSEAEPSKID